MTSRVADAADHSPHATGSPLPVPGFSALAADCQWHQSQRRLPRTMAQREDASDDDLSRRAESAPSPNGGAAEVDARIAAMLPAELLQPSEIIILLIKPSPWFILLTSLGSLAIIAVTCALLVLMHNRGYLGFAQRNDFILAGVGVGLVRLFWQFLEWLSRLYVLTDQRIIRVKGVTRVQVFESMLKNVQHTEMVFSIRERLFGLGTVTFATSGSAGIEAAWQMVAQPLEVHRIVVQAISRYGR